MLDNSPKDAVVKINSISFIQLAWPSGLSYSNGSFIGFVMPYVDLSRSSTLDFYLDKRLYDEKFSHNPLSLSYRIEIARNLAGVIKALHSKNHFFIDFKPQNVRVYDRYHLISLIDCDGFSIAGLDGSRYPAESFSSEYICPPALRSNSLPSNLGLSQDLFALAVVIFQLLNFGIHPYSGLLTNGDSASTTDEKVAKGYYSYGKVENPNIKPIKNSAHFAISDDIRDLFDRAFSPNSASPPSVDDWISVLDKVLADKLLVKCDKFPTNAEHIRFEGKDCAVCFRSEISGRVRITSGNSYSNSGSPVRKGTPFLIANPSVGIGAASKPKTKSSSSEIFGIEKNILIAAIVVGIVIMLLVISAGNNKSSLTSQTQQSAPVNPTSDIKGKWQIGNTCAEGVLNISPGYGDTGTVSYIYSDTSKSHSNTFNQGAKSSDGTYSMNVEDGEWHYLLSYKKLNSNQLRLMRMVFYPTTKPSEQKAYILNGLDVENAQPTGPINRCP
jgi:serine/threonine protein kinase